MPEKSDWSNSERRGGCCYSAGGNTDHISIYIHVYGTPLHTATLHSNGPFSSP